MTELQLPHNAELAVTSHGWCRLAPATLSDESSIVWFTGLPNSKPSRIEVSWSKSNSITISGSKLSPEDRAYIQGRVRWMFRADESFEPFWRICSTDPVLCKCKELKAGALIRSATIFEDVVKTLCTTNCHWRNTKRMVFKLCELYGLPCLSDSGVATGYTFPTADRLASLTEEELALVGLGYRSNYIKTFAQDVTQGRVDLGSWATSTDATLLRKQILRVRGLGSYSANHMLMLLGHYGFIPCDTEVCAYLGLPPGTPLPQVDVVAKERYGKWGSYAYLAYKFERVLNRLNYVDC